MARTESPAFGRRTVMKAGLVGALGLTACGDGTDNDPSNSGPAELPRFKARELVKPDLPGTAEGVQQGYFSFPASPAKAVDPPLKDWGSMRSLVLTYVPPPPAMANNSYWQAVNAKAGGTLEVSIVPQADYDSKVGAVLAGDDVPDTVLMTGTQLSMADLPRLLKARFADLTEQLAGDAISDYPNLAAIPSYSWRSARIAGGIWGVPIEQQVLTNVLMGRVDLVKKAGATPDDIKTTDDFRDVCVAMTDARAGKWALGPFGPSMMIFFAAAFGAPNNWGKKSDGTMVKDFETDEYVAALEYHVELSDKGVFHPDFLGLSVTQAKQFFTSGTTAMYLDGLAAWRAYTHDEKKSLSEVGVMLPFASPGKKPAFYISGGIFGVTMLSKGSSEDIVKRLKVLDFLAAPFGTEEWLVLNYGVEGKHHERQNGNPVLTPLGENERRTSFQFVGGPANVMFSGSNPDWVRAQHAWETKVVPTGIADPTAGVYIEPDRERSAAEKIVVDTMIDVVAKRKKISDFTAAVAAWRTKGGDKFREQLQDALS